ncbi:MAG: hypothetical protein N2Z58_02620 [Fervidobacterium sp.]|nr:hypothetical protein [Fervidobacterium sp.]
MKKLGIILAVVFLGLMTFAQTDLSSIINRIELLEEYANMIYDAVGTKLAIEDFDEYVAQMEERISALEIDVLNIKSSIMTGMPALRDMLYELSSNLSNVEARLTSYVEVAIGSLKEELGNLMQTDWTSVIEDLKVTLDIHDSDILKIYETLGTLSEQVSALSEMLAGQEELLRNVEALALKVNMHDQDVVNIYDNLSAKADREQVDMLEASITELYDSINGLNEILTGLAAQIGDTDYLLRKQISDLEKNINTKLGDYVTKTALEEKLSSIYGTIDDLKVTLDIHDSDILKIYETLGTLSDQLAILSEAYANHEEKLQKLVNRNELLEEYVNMVYDVVNTKLSQEDFESANEATNKKIEETNKKIEETKVEINKKIDNVNLVAWLGLILGTVALVISFVK